MKLYEWPGIEGSLAWKQTATAPPRQRFKLPAEHSASSVSTNSPQLLPQQNAARGRAQSGPPVLGPRPKQSSQQVQPRDAPLSSASSETDELTDDPRPDDSVKTELDKPAASEKAKAEERTEKSAMEERLLAKVNALEEALARENRMKAAAARAKAADEDVRIAVLVVSSKS